MVRTLSPAGSSFTRRPLSRRSFIAAGCAGVLVSAGPALAAGPRDANKLVIVILRGALDGVAALPKLDDRHIEGLRPNLIDRSAVPMADGFALHSAMPGLAAAFRAGQASFAPAIAGPYRERSHFEAQDLLECGGVTRVLDEGWLNRALQKAPAPMSAVSIGPVQPMLLRGKSTATTSWSPSVLPEASDDTLARLADLYAGDPLLASALAGAMSADAVAHDMEGGGMAGMAGARRGGDAAQLMSAAGKFLVAEGGPQIAVVSLEGWDTQTAQAPALAQRLGGLDKGLTALQQAMGPAWARTAVVVVSEFGRTVRENGGRGSDHGTGGLAMLAGGAVRGGRIIGDWPTLAPGKLFEDRDLMPTLDVRSLFKGVLRDQLGWPAGDLDGFIFPDSASARALDGLLRA